MAAVLTVLFDFRLTMVRTSNLKSMSILGEILQLRGVELGATVMPKFLVGQLDAALQTVA